MQELFRKSNLVWLLSIGMMIVFFIVLPAAAKEGSGRSDDKSASLTTENWNMGITVEGTPSYTALVGRLVSDVGVFRSARSTQAATIFPAPASQKTIKTASVYVLSRSGTYTGTVTLSLEIYDLSGSLQHKVNTVDIDLQTAPTDAWIPLTLSTSAVNLSISPGEFLAFTYRLNGVPGGNLDVRPLFDVSVE